ncbi:LysM peptidoglycan-binding domain-containing protein [Brevibacillus parabrevis]|uniref:LysM peptidoglycan-binding domain-containing protein n=1 Tax=Brevibacillus parabrevis TaxID=54914 RepID=UPI0028D8D236|nr:LysM peptidoglycan-binding domain-containing protein [Brevibacillus parabrevis]MED1723712.1 LysM peptidoglycan-binding domain-containing protein [Brevibacillus parabrevis]
MFKTTRWKRLALQATLVAGLLPATSAFAQTIQVVPGDTLGNIAYKNQITVEQLKLANQLQSDMIMVGQTLYIPPRSTVYTVKAGDVLWKIAYSHGVSIQTIVNTNKLQTTEILIGQKLLIPKQEPAAETPAPAPAPKPEPEPDKPWVESTRYQVAKGDTPWTISIAHGIPFTEFLQANKLSESDYLQIGQIVTVPVHHIPKTETAGAKYGEYLDWFEAAQYLFPINATAKVTDFATGKSFMVKRTIGASHSDTEPLTSADSAIIKSIWGGNFSWSIRPVIVEVDGRRLAASMSSMPHSIEYITDNAFDGHFDIHFPGSLRHKDNLIDPDHQAAIRIAAGK